MWQLTQKAIKLPGPLTRRSLFGLLRVLSEYQIFITNNSLRSFQLHRPVFSLKRSIGNIFCKVFHKLDDSLG